MVKPHRRRQQGLQPHRARRRLGEGQALAFLVLRGVEAGDHVDQPLGHRLDHGQPVLLGAQGRGEAEEGAIAADVIFVQRQVMDRDTGTDVQPRLARAAQRRQAGRDGDLVGMVAGAGHRHQRQVAVEPHHLGHGRNRRQAVERGELAPGRRRAFRQARLLRVADDQRAQAAGIGHAARQEPGVRDHPHPVGEGHGAGILQKAHLDHLAPFAGAGQRRHVADVHRRVGRPAGGEFQRFRRIDRRHGVGPRDQRGHAPRGRRQPGAAEAFLVPLARLANLDAPVDQPGREAFAAAVDQLGALRGLGAHRLDHAVADGQRTFLDRLRLGVDQPGIVEVQDHAIISAALAPRSARRLRASRSIAAMRTATPIST